MYIDRSSHALARRYKKESKTVNSRPLFIAAAFCLPSFQSTVLLLLTVAAFAEKAKQPIPFMTFMKIAFPIMILTLAISNVYLWLRYF